MNDVKWTGEGESLRLSVSVPGVAVLLPVSDLIACLKANPDAVTPEQWAEVLRGYPEVKRYAIATTFLDTEGYWVSCEARAEQAERERDEALSARATIDAHLSTLVRERDEARARLRYTCQVLVEAAGADGPLNAEEAAKRAAGQLDSLRSRLAKTEAVARKVAALRLGPLGHCLEHMAMLVAEARRALDEDSGGSGAATSTGASNAPEAGSTPEPAGSSRYVACRGCGQPLASDLAAQRIADGCPCNSHRGINHGLVPVHVCTCATCDPEQTGSARQRPDPQAPATRAEVEELRSRVERMENLTGCTPKE